MSSGNSTEGANDQDAAPTSEKAEKSSVARNGSINGQSETPDVESNTQPRRSRWSSALETFSPNW